MKKLLLIIFILFVVVPVLILGYLGIIPGLSDLMGANKPRDLGIKYSQSDLSSIHAKSLVKYETLPSNVVPAMTRLFSGERQFSGDFSSAEITATMNNQNWIHWPFKNLQVKFNADGSGEISGTLIKSKVSGYAASIGVPQQAADFIAKYIPNDPAFYVKGKAALSENKVSVFEPQAFQIGRIPMPVSVFLAMVKINPIPLVYAQDVSSMTEELSKVNNKKALIIGFINNRLSSAYGKFYANKAYFTEGNVHFEGVLTEKISYTPR